MEFVTFELNGKECMSNLIDSFCSWSGGKDCCLALYRYRQKNPDKKIALLTMLKQETNKTYGHFVNESILKRQADALGLKIFFGYSNSNDYEEKWCEEIDKLKKMGVKSAIFGDIDLDEHYVWIDRVLEKMNIKMEMPLWKEKRLDLVNEVVDIGYKAKIISVKDGKCPPKYLGTILDKENIKILSQENIDPSAEGGEFHTLVTDGPYFRKRLKLKVIGISNNYNHTYLNLN